MNSKRSAEAADIVTEKREEWFVRPDPLVSLCDLPHGVVEYTEDELAGIREFFSERIDGAFIPCPYVFLSDKIKKRTYGKYTENELIRKLREYETGMAKTPMYEYFREVLNCVIQNLSDPADPVLCADTLAGAERMAGLDGTDEDQKVFREMQELIQQLKVENLILGEYLTDRHQIVLYVKAIERECGSPGKHMDFFCKLSSVLAHEYFHAMHYAVRPGHMIWSGTAAGGLKAFQKAELTEAPADYFSVLWCFERAHISPKGFIDVAEERTAAWRKHLYSAWPYARALYIMRDDQSLKLPTSVDEAMMWKGFDLFLQIFEESVHDTFAAYKMLKWR